ncbi:dihydroxyacetone kinase subunit DhaK [Pasteurellaceae bacterium LIM206]|nr:dihydroxyacetone kinase subunit DhaK [Pasteurellaceae bacterium LIM206]
MKKIINQAEQYTDDMLRGIYAVHQNQVKYIANDLRCYCTTHKTPGKVAIITGGGNGHLPLFLGYVGDGMLDGCGVGNVFQSPSGKQIYQLTKELESGAGVLYLYGNYTGDIMVFDDAAERCEMDDIKTRSIVGADDVTSNADINVRRGVAGIFFMYKAAGAKAKAMGSLDDVFNAAQKAKENTRTVGFALSPCIIPEKGIPNFTLAENEMAMGMGIHGEPGIWNGPIKTAREIAQESIDTILADMPCPPETEVALLINGLGSTPLDELYILADSVISYLNHQNIKVYRTWVGEFATSMEMSGASISICKVDDELKDWFDAPVHTPFYTQN